jgi:hypothetical protein
LGVLVERGEQVAPERGLGVGVLVVILVTGDDLCELGERLLGSPPLGVLGGGVDAFAATSASNSWSTANPIAIAVSRQRGDTVAATTS